MRLCACVWCRRWSSDVGDRECSHGHATVKPSTLPSFTPNWWFCGFFSPVPVVSNVGSCMREAGGWWPPNLSTPLDRAQRSCPKRMQGNPTSVALRTAQTSRKLETAPPHSSLQSSENLTANLQLSAVYFQRYKICACFIDDEACCRSAEKRLSSDF